jgi:hypothetical protein
MQKTRSRRDNCGTQSEPGGVLIIALLLLACGAFALFAGLFREPLPDEMLAAFASRWAAVDEAGR